MISLAAAGSGENILPLPEKHKPDVMLPDYGLLSWNSLSIVKERSIIFPGLRIIIRGLISLHDEVWEFVRT